MEMYFIIILGVVSTKQP